MATGSVLDYPRAFVALGIGLSKVDISPVGETEVA